MLNNVTELNKHILKYLYYHVHASFKYFYKKGENAYQESSQTETQAPHTANRKRGKRTYNNLPLNITLKFLLKWQTFYIQSSVKRMTLPYKTCLVNIDAAQQTARFQEPTYIIKNATSLTVSTFKTKYFQCYC